MENSDFCCRKSGKCRCGQIGMILFKNIKKFCLLGIETEQFQVFSGKCDYKNEYELVFLLNIIIT